ncbi:hypothetical protein HQ587_07605 [bacterium]|nr:hypothetical protein [bacterium]
MPSRSLSINLRPMNKQHNTTLYSVHIAMMKQIQADLLDLKEDMRELRAAIKADQKELWRALNGLRESITGNSREGLAVRVDRNTNFRRTLTKLLWALFTPLYGALIVLLLKTLLTK